jgi:uncharacterized membrane protein YgcG
MRDHRARLGAAMALGFLLAGCGEPSVELAPPARPPGAHVYDEAGVVAGSVDDRLAVLGEDTGFDVVALAYEDDRATMGQADRAGRLLLDTWNADIVLVAVAFPGDFENPDPEARQRFFGVTATDRFTVTRGLRERIVEEAVPAPAADNNWTGAFHAAIDELEADLARDGA